MHHRCCTLVFQLSNKLITPPPPPQTTHDSKGREDYKRSIGGVGWWVKYRKETAIRNILDSG